MASTPSDSATVGNDGVFCMLQGHENHGSIDIISPTRWQKPLRYFFVREEVQKNGPLTSNIADLMLASLMDYKKATEEFEPHATEAKTKVPRSIETVKELNRVYARIVEQFIEKPSGPLELSRIASEPLGMVMNLVYNRNIEEVKELNNYLPWTPETYGETKHEFVQVIIDALNIGEEDSFLDLGSGVGNVVIQVAALCFCKTLVGIEIVEARADFAKKMDKEFRSLMGWLGKKYGNYELIHGDFLDHKNRIQTANVIFCNNYAFTPELNLKLKIIFADLPEKVKILVSKSLTDEKFRIYDTKTALDASAVLPVCKTFPGKVSWTDTDVNFYLHEVDRSTLEKFMKSREDPELRAQFEEEQRQGRPNYYESSSEQDSQGVERFLSDLDTTEDDDAVKPRRGITTRSQWRNTGRRRRLKPSRDSDQSDTQDENSPSTISELHSEASSERTRSIPLQDSTPKQGVKRKRGRPPKSATRSAPSSSGSSARCALQSLFIHTQQSIKDVDRSVQAGCVPDTIEKSDELPPVMQDFLRKIEHAMRNYVAMSKLATFPDSLAKQTQEYRVTVSALKSRAGRLESEVKNLRLYCSSFVEMIFRGLSIVMPRSANDVSEASRTILQQIQLNKHRYNTLKDDIHWLKNSLASTDSQTSNESIKNEKHSVAISPTGAGGHRGFSDGIDKSAVFLSSPVTSAAWFPPTLSNSRRAETSGQPSLKSRAYPVVDGCSENEKRNSKEAADAMDLSRPSRRELKDNFTKHMSADYSSGSLPHSKQSPSSRSHSMRKPTYQSALDKVIEDTLSSGSVATSHSNRSGTNAVGNLRGLSPAISVEREKSSTRSQPSEQLPTIPSSPKSAATQIKHNNHKTSTAEQSNRHFVMNNAIYPSHQPQYSTNLNGPQAGDFYGYPAYGAYGQLGGLYMQQHPGASQLASARQNSALWSNPYSGGMFDASQMAASLSASFSAIPGRRRGDGDQIGHTMSLEAISPPPQMSL